MASVVNDPDGRKRVLFVDPDGVRKAIRLGKTSKRVAESLKFRIEQLLAAKLTGYPLDSDTASWVAGLSSSMADKLCQVGLIPKRKAEASTALGPFMTAHIEGRADLKRSTKVVRGQVIRDLTDFFGENCDVRSIDPGQADDFKQQLIKRGLASTTIHKRLQVARSFFHAMRRRKLIDENPFEGVQSAASGIKDRQRFVTRQEILQVLDACPDHHWRTIVSLSRFGGLRCPSEVLSLRWQDINWEKNRIVVQSPKTEHHADKASRTIPLFSELLPYLVEAFELASDGAEFVVDEKFRKSAMGPNGWLNANLRTTFGKIIRRAGLETWPRLFHNLRASRETELVEKYPIQVVTGWLGNSPTVAMRHYLMTTEEHFEAAIRPSDEEAQNPAQQVLERSRRSMQLPKPAKAKTSVVPGFASNCETLQIRKIAVEGFEPPTRGL